jgi:hypothetical protein
LSLITAELGGNDIITYICSANRKIYSNQSGNILHVLLVNHIRRAFVVPQLSRTHPAAKGSRVQLTRTRGLARLIPSPALSLSNIAEWDTIHTDPSDFPPAPMDTPYESSEPSVNSDIPSSDDNDFVSSALNAPINCDKALPPMPRPSLEEEAPDDTAYGDSGREDEFDRQSTRSWMDMDSGSDTDDTGEHPLIECWQPQTHGDVRRVICVAVNQNHMCLFWV